MPISRLPRHYQMSVLAKNTVLMSFSLTESVGLIIRCENVLIYILTNNFLPPKVLIKTFYDLSMENVVVWFWDREEALVITGIVPQSQISLYSFSYLIIQFGENL